MEGISTTSIVGTILGSWALFATASDEFAIQDAVLVGFLLFLIVIVAGFLKHRKPASVRALEREHQKNKMELVDALERLQIARAGSDKLANAVAKLEADNATLTETVARLSKQVGTLECRLSTYQDILSRPLRDVIYPEPTIADEMAPPFRDLLYAASHPLSPRSG
jgi:hypothetical protein